MPAQHRAEANRGPFARIRHSFTAVVDRLFHNRGGAADIASPLPDAAAAPACIALPPPSPALPARNTATLQSLPIELMHAITNWLTDHRDVAHLASVSASMRALFQHNDRLLLAPSRLRMQVGGIGEHSDIRALVADVMAARMGHEETAAILLAISAKLRALAKCNRLDAAIALIDALGTLPDSVLARQTGRQTLIEHCVDYCCLAFNGDADGQARSMIDRVFHVFDRSRSDELQGLAMFGLACGTGWFGESIQRELRERILARVATLPREHQHRLRGATG
ncbi:hypothetical protein OJJOAM_000585 [Cupriavidus sp. H18C1]|uniref:hypothetical protein n=1 Tax=Cupriavidus sp. H18C1 TaxID=3241601 RepID=UPI003BB89CD8